MPRRTRRATEFTIKQKARGNKGDKIFPSENIYDEPYFKEQWHTAASTPLDRPAERFCEESGIVPARRIDYLLVSVKLKYVNLADELARQRRAS